MLSLEILEMTLWGLSIFCSTTAFFLAVVHPGEEERPLLTDDEDPAFQRRAAGEAA